MRSSVVRRLRLAGLGGLAAALLACCVGRPPCDSLGCAAACPRDAKRDASGRCACTPGAVLVLGACVSPALGDAYCGPGERMGADGCSARACAADETLDVATGACTPRGALRRDRAACPDASVAADRMGAVVCLRRADTCPQGTHRDREGARCVRPPGCPPGSLPEGEGCRSFVSYAGESPEARRVDVGAWAVAALGVDGGPGSDDLCRALARRPDVFGVGPGETRGVLVRVDLTIPDQDVTRAVASVHARLEGGAGAAAAAGAVGGAGTSPPQAASGLLERTLASLVEPFRGLGGESSTAAFEATVHCVVTSP